MNRFIGWLCLALMVCGGQQSWATAPPVAPAMQLLSLAGAAKQALEYQGFRVDRRDDGSIRVVHDASRITSLEAKRVANQTLLNAEVAYWNLYRTRTALSGRQQALRRAHDSLRICKTRHEAGTATEAEVSQARKQHESFSAQCRAASGEVAESERQLASLIGVGLQEVARMRLSDRPSLIPYRPDWDAALRAAVSRRPELLMAHNEVSTSMEKLAAAKVSQALRNIPTVANRTPSSNDTPLETFQAQLARDLEVLHDQEDKAQNFLYLYYRRLSLNYKQIQATRATREAFGELLRARNAEYAADRCTLAKLLEAQRSWADSLDRESSPIAAYNNSIAGFEYGKGTILDRHHMVFAENRKRGAK